MKDSFPFTSAMVKYTALKKNGLQFGYFSHKMLLVLLQVSGSLGGGLSLQEGVLQDGTREKCWP